MYLKVDNIVMYERINNIMDPHRTKSIWFEQY